jgi:hypothetical protein
VLVTIPPAAAAAELHWAPVQSRMHMHGGSCRREEGPRTTHNPVQSRVDTMHKLCQSMLQLKQFTTLPLP